ncbi:MAG TPA: NAD(P)-binding domain-containing protein [Cellvibrio sp.]|nr:NAD(P)-binding domain-containing protein [Cellvibrio sp.]
MNKVTVIGLGAMGTALANTLHDKGVQVTVWNRSAEKAVPLIAKGMRCAPNVAAAIEDSSLIIISVLDYLAVTAILHNAEESLRGKTLVNLTNGTPSQAREMAYWILQRGAEYLDGGVMVTPELVGGENAFVFYSGSASAYQQHQSILTLLGGPVYVGENIALAAIYDLALLSSMFGMFGGYIHAAALLRSEKIPVAEVTPMIMSLLNAMIELFPQTAQEIDSGVYPQPNSNNTMMTAGLHNILVASEEQSVRDDLIKPIWELFNQASRNGLGDKDISALPQLLTTKTRAKNIDAKKSCEQ